MPVRIVAMLMAISTLTAACSSPEPQAANPTTAIPTTAVPGTSTSVVSTAAPTMDQVLTGSEVLARRRFAELAGKRVGLIAHRPSMVGEERLADLLHQAPDVELVALFAPEHGLFGLADAGAAVGDEIDRQTGVDVFSLYGATRSPTPASLEDIDVLLYDLQDVGARFFTYISTLGLAMQAAADADISFVVLDRPNPLGGGLQGPLLDAGLESFIGQYQIPSAYGLTAGELARTIKAEELLPGLSKLDLAVVPVQGWSRDQRWTETARQWIRPSPNLPTIDGVLLYPGTVLFEATSISEGRGTNEPFEVIGAPWIDGAALAASMNSEQLPGVRFEAVAFTPQVIEGAAQNPRYLGEALSGVRILVQDPAMVSGLEVGLSLLRAVIDLGLATGRSPEEIINRPDVFDRLAGSPDVRKTLEEGSSIRDLVASFAADHERFAQRTQPHLLYG